jgi:quinol monooxygenase YgiN
MSKVFLFVDVDIKDGQRAAFLEKLKAHAKKVVNEPGCEALDIYENSENPNSVCIWEVWSTRADWDLHMTCDNTMAWRPVAAPYVNGEVITVMNPA